MCCQVLTFLTIMHTYMQVFQRLQKLNICVSHQTLTSIISAAGTKFDEKVMEELFAWKLAETSEG